MKLYTEEQVRLLLDLAKLKLNGEMYSKDVLLEQVAPIELPSDLDKLKKLIEDRPAEFSQYNAYFYLYIIDLIKNGKEVPEQIELIKMIREKK